MTYVTLQEEYRKLYKINKHYTCSTIIYPILTVVMASTAMLVSY